MHDCTYMIIFKNASLVVEEKNKRIVGHDFARGDRQGSSNRLRGKELSK